MAIAAVDEAFRNVICVGGDPAHTAILDNFCWPKVDSPYSLGTLVRACKGAADAALAYGLPFISGKDSLNNEFSMGEEESRRTGLPSRLAIPGTLLISALSVIKDARRCVSMDFKAAGNFVVLASAPADQVGLQAAYLMHARVASLIADGKVFSAHDVSDGGLAATIAEMCIASQFGASIDISGQLDSSLLFDDASGTYVLEMAEGEARSSGLPIIGRVEHEPRLRVQCAGTSIIDLAVSELASAWRSPLPESVGATLTEAKSCTVPQ